MQSINEYSWPDDYKALDSGRLLVRPDVVPVFEAVGWTRLCDILEASDLQRNALHPDRDNCRFQLPSHGSAPCGGLFLKRHAHHQPGNTPAWDEANATERCRRAGVSVMRIAAVGAPLAQDAGSRSRWDSVFVSDQIGDGQSAYHCIKSLKADPVAPADNRIDQVLDAAARTTWQLHAAGMFHGDCHWTHLILDRVDTGELGTTLIDLQNTRQSEGVRAKYMWIKDLAQMNNSMKGLRLTPEEADYFFSCYFGHGMPLPHVRLSQNAIRKLAEVRGEVRQWHRELRKRRRQLGARLWRRAGILF